MDNYAFDSLGKILTADKEDRASMSGARNCEMPSTAFPSETPIGMAYVPYQMWEEPYDMETAHSRGTIFPSLDKPFIGEEAVKRAHSK